MKQHHLRAILNEELHTRPFHDFEGTGRFIRYIYLLEQSDASIFSAVNSWLTLTRGGRSSRQMKNSGVRRLMTMLCGLSVIVNL